MNSCVHGKEHRPKRLSNGSEVCTVCRHKTGIKNPAQIPEWARKKEITLNSLHQQMNRGPLPQTIETNRFTQAKQNTVISLVRSGHSLTFALQKADITLPQYHYLRSHDEQFVIKVDTAKEIGKTLRKESVYILN